MKKLFFGVALLLFLLPISKVSASENGTKQLSGDYGGSVWTWEDETQTLSFEGGYFPDAIEGQLSTGYSGFAYGDWPRLEPLHIPNGHTIYAYFEFSGRLNQKKIKHINFKNDVFMGHYSYGIFSNLTELETIENGQNIKLLNVLDIECLFFNTPKLKYVDTSNWDTSSVRFMNGVFGNTKSLSNVDISNWNTSHVRRMNSMFKGSSIQGLDMSNWNTSKVEDAASMFAEMSEIKKLDLSSWNIQNMASLDYMFAESPKLKSINISNFDKFNYENAEPIDGYKRGGIVYRVGENRNPYNFGMNMLGYANVDEIILGNNLFFKDDLDPNKEFSLSEKKDNIYTGKWINEKGHSYSSSQDLLENYDGKYPGTYTREKF